MKLYPTKTAAHLAIVASGAVAVGLVTKNPAIVGWAGSMLFALALARAATLVSVARIRAAGFEMLWSTPKRVTRTTRGGVVEIEAEVRNRDTLSARYVRLRAIASSELDVSIEPDAGEVTANGRLKVKVKVKAPRVGLHGVHGLALEVHGSPGLFEVPLTFANPYGIEVLPRPFAPLLTQPRGGRSRLIATSGRPGKTRGDGTDLRELREHAPGDSFRRIAWKASARRNKLMVREFEREERDVVWVVLDSALDLWAGPVGRAPLDAAIDEAAAIATRHLVRGDRVGLAITSPGYGAERALARPPRVFLRPDEGPAHAHRIAHSLAVGCACYDAERSELDEPDVAARVLEHLRPIDPKGLADVRRGDFDTLAARADAARGRAPFSVPSPTGRSQRERQLRRYLAAYGVDAPAATTREGDPALALAQTLALVAKQRPAPSLVYVVGSLPEERVREVMLEAIRRLRHRGATVTWASAKLDAGLAPPWNVPALKEESARASARFRENAPLASEAVGLRVLLSERRREKWLRSVGVRMARGRAQVRRPELPPEPGERGAP
jgi:uncharacterized protein (DUF58 family)